MPCTRYNIVFIHPVSTSFSLTIVLCTAYGSYYKYNRTIYFSRTWVPALLIL